MAEQTKAQGRSSFASRFGFIMVAAGAAIGLGNVWRFPYQAYENGGAAFILVYIIIVAIIGKAGIEMEAAIGRNGKCNAIRAYGKINKNSRFIGGIGILFTFMLDMYYVVVGGSVLWYAVNYLISGDFGTDTAVYYDQFISNPIIPLICTAVLMAIIGVILSAGITKWVERISKIMMPCLFVLLVISGILALFTSPNAMEGLKYYIVPNFSDFTFTSFSNACVQCMFSIGIGWTLYVTLGSRMSEDQNIKKDAIWICVLDTLAAVLAGFVVIPSVVGAGSVMQAGPSLVFVAMPQIFAGMAIGRFLGFLFFAILILAVISSMFTFIEIPAAVVEEHLRVSHKKAVIITSLAVFVFAILCCWSQGSAGILSGVELPFVSMSGVATLSIIDWVDSFSSYILMPLGNICVALFVWRVWGFARYEKELTANGRDGSLSKFSKFVIIVAIPVFSVICLLNAFGFIA